MLFMPYTGSGGVIDLSDAAEDQSLISNGFSRSFAGVEKVLDISEPNDESNDPAMEE